MSPSGRFGAGNQLGRGAHRGHKDNKALYEAFKSAVSPEDVIEIAKAIMDKAKRDPRYAKLFCEYLFGLPQQVTDVNMIAWTPQSWLASLEQFEQGEVIEGEIVPQIEAPKEEPELPEIDDDEVPYMFHETGPCHAGEM